MSFNYIGAGSLASIAVACAELILEGLKDHRSLNREEVEGVKRSVKEIAKQQGGGLHNLAVALMAKAIGPYVKREMAKFGALVEPEPGQEGKKADA